MQTLRFILFSFITLTIISNAQTVVPPGDVSGTWNVGGSPYLITGEITIPNGLTLTIEPGVLVEFQGHYKLNVQGRLLAVGAETDTIVFTINDTTGFHNPNIPDGGWHSIRFIWTSPANDSSKIVYCKLQYGKAIGPGKDHSGGAICVEGFDKLTIANCLITNNIAGGIDWTAGGGIALWISSPVLIGNTISNNSASEGGGVEFYGSNATVMNNIFVNNLASAGGGLIIKDNSNIVLINDSIANNVADNGGGIISWGSSIIIMEEVDLVENTALLYSGGGVNIFEGGSLTMNNCTFIDNEALSGNGGGLTSNNSNVTITDCDFNGNQANNGSGGGIDISDESIANIINCTITNNSAEAGGGIVCNAYSNPTITNTIIENNTAWNYGGGIVSWGSDLQINNCTFTGNIAIDGSGGGISAENSDVQIDSCNFISNEALGGNGGGIEAGECDLQIDNCSFVENKAPNWGGGAIALRADTTYSGLPYQVTINNTSFSENTASSSGGVFISNWGWIPLIINVTINNCEFLDNVSDLSTGLTIWDCGFSISNSVFAGNTAVNFAAGAGFTVGSIGTVSNCLFASNITSTGGGSVSVWAGANVDFMNCTFADNLASYGAGLGVGGGGIATTTNCIFWGNSTDQIALETWNNVGGTLTVNYCDVQDGEDSVKVIDPLLSTLNWGDGNIDADPFFVDPLISDYHLQDSSLCIGAAIDSIEIGGVWYYCPLYDIEGNPRPNPPGSMPDIGAYESPLDSPVYVEKYESLIPVEYALRQNYPNPFNPATTIVYGLRERANVELILFDVLGREIETIVNGEQDAGYYEVEFNASRLASGIYFYRLQAGSFVETKKMILMK